SYLDVRQALDDLGIDDAHAADLGIRLYKVAMSWPLEREGIRNFAEGLEEILVVEEKRAIIENQFKEQLYNWREDVRPRIIGKFDESHNWILPSNGELTPAQIGRAPFTETRHGFANHGDGTYTHSGVLAIRAAVAAKVNITYKLLFNDAVAMTGGQPIDGDLTVPALTRQLAAEGVQRIVVVTDEPDKYSPGADFAAG